MVYRYTLPIRQNPFPAAEYTEYSRSKTITAAELSPQTFKRGRISSQQLRILPESYNTESKISPEDKENVWAGEKLSSLYTPTHEVETSGSDFDPGDSNTWGVKPLPRLSTGSMLPISQRTASGLLKADDDAAILRSPIIPLSPEPMPDCERFLKLIDDNLTLDGGVDQHLPGRYGRSTSSYYNSHDYESDGVKSPVSVVHIHKLSFSDLAKYSRRNDRLSNLRSSASSSSSSSDEAKSNIVVGAGDALEDATAAIQEWKYQTISHVLPYNSYEYRESTDVLPSDSLSQQQSPESVIRRAPIPVRQSSIS